MKFFDYLPCIYTHYRAVKVNFLINTFATPKRKFQRLHKPYTYIPCKHQILNRLRHAGLFMCVKRMVNIQARTNPNAISNKLRITLLSKQNTADKTIKIHDQILWMILCYLTTATQYYGVSKLNSFVEIFAMPRRKLPSINFVIHRVVLLRCPSVGLPICIRSLTNIPSHSRKRRSYLQIWQKH